MYTFTGGKEPDRVYRTSLYSVNATTKKHLEDRYLLYFQAEEDNRAICAVVTVASNILTCTGSVANASIGKILVVEWLQSEHLLRPGSGLSLVQQGYAYLTQSESALILYKLKELAELQKDKDKE